MISFVSVITMGQSMEDLQKEYATFAQLEQESYSDFVKKENAAFEEFLKNEWLRFKEMQGIPAPVKPLPVKPVIFQKPEKPIPMVKIPVAKPITIQPYVNSEPEQKTKPTIKPTTQPEAQKTDPKVEEYPENPLSAVIPKPTEQEILSQPERVSTPKLQTTNRISVLFYGHTENFPYTSEMKLNLSDNSEQIVAEAWGKIANSDYMPTIDALKKFKEAYSLNDWAYYLLTKHFAQSFTNHKETNESTVLHMFILAQSGYRAKLARKGNDLLLLLGTKQLIYQHSFLTIDGINYYLLTDRSTKGNTLYTYPSDFAMAKNILDMNIASPMKTPLAQAKESHTSRMNINTQTIVNKRIIDFYNDYPQCDFKVYMKAPMSAELQKSLLPVLYKSITGKSQKEAANLLLNYVQTAFNYKTDTEQFGYEKPFFVDEMFYYPYSDCEDRSILFSYLVRRLMGLEVVLLDYPNHIATAVRFTENVTGDYLMYKGSKYIICDPTYIGAPIGLCMPQYKTTPATIIEKE